MIDFPQVVGQYQASLLRRAAWKFGDMDAEDLVQETWLRLWEFTGEIAHMGAFLRRTLDTVGFHAIRDAGRQKRTAPDTSLMETFVPAAQEHAAELTAVSRLVDALPDRTREALVAMALGDTLQEVAGRQQISHQAVRQKVLAARRKIR